MIILNPICLCIVPGCIGFRLHIREPIHLLYHIPSAAASHHIHHNGHKETEPSSSSRYPSSRQSNAYYRDPRGGGDTHK